jgi:hypothetical protein
MIGMFYFYMLSDFSYTIYAKNVSYYSFDKGMAVMLMLCIIFPLKEVWREWLCVGAFFAIRLLWEMLAIQDYASASRPSIIFSLFFVDVLCTIIIFIIRITKTKA